MACAQAAGARAFVVLSFVVGDYVAPTSERLAQLLKGRYQNSITVGQTGGLVEGKKSDSSYRQCEIVNANNAMQGVQIFSSTPRGSSLRPLHTGSFSPVATPSFNSPH
jgi:lipopolysaccharide export LptBFGC system permease protein LptF